MRKRIQQAGFTLIELILVIVILGIVGNASAHFLRAGFEIYATSTSRAELVAQGRFMLERLSRELRGAAPNSVRVCGDSSSNLCPVTTDHCLEYTPFLTSTIYVNQLPAAGEDLQVVNINPAVTLQTGNQISIYATSADEIYNSGLNKRHSLVSIDTSDPTTDSWNFGASAVFAASSPTKRAYVLSNPVMFCLQDQTLYRYSDYGFNSSMRSTNASGMNGVKLAKYISNVATNPLFNFNHPSLTRNAVLHLEAEFSWKQDETASFSHEIHFPNVP